MIYRVSFIFLVVSLITCARNATSASHKQTQTYWCEDILYNLSTHACRDGRVVRVNASARFFLTCGDETSFETYDKRTHTCENKKVVPLRGKASCGYELSKQDKKLGIRCCGSKPYNPGFQTCCHGKHTQKYRIHDSKPENKYVCCKLKAYRRSSPRAACHRSALNDRLFKAKAKVGTVDQKLCKEDTLVHMISVNKMTTRRNLNITVSGWKWRPSKSRMILRNKPNIRQVMSARFDKYSPVKGLTGERFLVFTSHIYTDQTFFLPRFNDKIIRFPKRVKDQKKMLKRIRKNCRLLS